MEGKERTTWYRRVAPWPWRTSGSRGDRRIGGEGMRSPGVSTRAWTPCHGHSCVPARTHNFMCADGQNCCLRSPSCGCDTACKPTGDCPDRGDLHRQRSARCDRPRSQTPRVPSCDRKRTDGDPEAGRACAPGASRHRSRARASCRARHRRDGSRPAIRRARHRACHLQQPAGSRHAGMAARRVAALVLQADLRSDFGADHRLRHV